MSNAPDITLVSTKELIDELFKRHDAVLIVREFRRTQGKANVLYDYSNGLVTAIGLAEYVKYGLMDRHFNPEKYDENEGE
jgi:hypothetical protein